jgi:GNAT superfamily N-acetyltransferase
MSTSDIIILRPAAANDATFVNDLLFATMHEYVEAAWPNDPVARRHYYEVNEFDPSNTLIIQCDGKDIGRLSTTVRADCVFIDEIHILREHGGKEAGTRVIEQVFEEAREAGLPVKLMVLKVNKKAQELYLKIGFRVIGEDEKRLYMQCAPEPPNTIPMRSN